MVSNDVVLRGGLILSVMILSAIFAGYLSGFTEKAEDITFEKLASNVSMVFNEIGQMEVGSSLIISFGDPPDDIEPYIKFRDTIGGQNPSLKVLPGSIYLELDGKRKLIIEKDNIIPTHTPLNDQPISSTALRTISRSSGGYSTTLPACIKIEIGRSVPDIGLFIYPIVNEDKDADILRDIQQFVEDNSLPVDVENKTMEVAIDNGLVLHEAGFIMGPGDGTVLKWGKCPSIFVLPYSIEFEIPGDEQRYMEGFTIKRDIEINDDGSNSCSWSISFS